VVPVSAVSGEGLHLLKSRLLSLVSGRAPVQEELA
jgi:hypothetical protein